MCLQQFCEKTEISKKMHGFVEQSGMEVMAVVAEENSDDSYVSRHVSALHTVEGFLSALTNADKDGRISTTVHMQQ